MGKFFLKNYLKTKMALSKTRHDGTRQIGGARAWWAVERFRAASSSISNLTCSHFLFVVHARHESLLGIVVT